MTRFIVAYFGTHDPRHVQADLKDIAQDFDGILYPVTEQDVAFDAAGVAERVRLAREAGLTVWISPWAVAGLFGGEGLSAIGHLCAQSCQAREEIGRWAAVARDAKPDAVLLDEPRDRCCPVTPVLLALMRQVKPIAVYCYWNPQVQPTKPAIGNGVRGWGADFYRHTMNAPFGRPSGESDAKQRLGALAARQAEKYVTHVWTQAFTLGRGDEAHTVEAIKRATAAGVDWVGVWGYRCSHAVGVLRCADPEGQWAAILDAVRDARGAGR